MFINRRCRAIAVVFCYSGMILHFMRGLDNNVTAKMEKNPSTKKIDFPPAVESIPVNIKVEKNSSNLIQSHESITGPSRLLSEVESISHFPYESKISVKFKRGGRLCFKPYLTGRLSGPYLSQITRWEEVTLNGGHGIATYQAGNHIENNSTVGEIIAYYEVPEAGHYFLEIIGILCNDIGINERYEGKCLEDPANHRITHMSASINAVKVSSSTYGRSRESLRDHRDGYWKWSINSPFEPLFTRYQPIGCRNETDKLDSRCSVPMTLKRFEPYQFYYVGHTRDNSVKTISVDRRASIVKSQALVENRADENINLCFVGQSHAREMAREIRLWLESWNVTNISAKHVDRARYPNEVTKSYIQEYTTKFKCSKSIIAAGQWSAAKLPVIKKPPTTFLKYYGEVREMIQNLKAMNTTGVYLRSIHYNALGDVKIKCPPEDWRSPPVIDGFNRMIRILVETMDVPFIDTNFIIGPMWDSGGDFCHYRNDKVARAEALYILSRLL
mmetsp:Transcript_5028/g.10170  ORF Transcript_5028/g.10170 Transcript_5028/m.10170 type:complete len:501 (+) Transcript_5028:157-1659(+)